ncbi:hypothetical protein FA15DRAFT_637969 [Coprinopsis marcescibilis]|uniref:ZZ-type domain-containing protein n=1 Tax=Coprinopsis marcescibilis TaxID=230819 RepID=A0A5C3KZU8_COPMA|nr:hypothetical protein FA15DRAFT_637969 [Coprinopsis marcescibilis]
MSISDLPDRPLTVKCTFDKAPKKISFNSARNCSYHVLKEKVEKCFSLRSSIISWKDDDGETTHIVSDLDLAEAIQYFCSGDDAPMSSAASILSGRSFGPRKITLRVTVTVDYDGPSLSDTSSLASIEEFRSRNGSKRSILFNPQPKELDDDSMTVSSRDQIGSSAGSTRSRSNPTSGSSYQFVGSSPTIHQQSKTAGSSWKTSSSSQSSFSLADPTSHHGSTRSDDVNSALQRYPANPSNVFAQLKLQEELGDANSDWGSIRGEDRGARWLRDQKNRAIRTMLGALPEPSVSEESSLFDSLSGDLSLERNNSSGRYYYTYKTISGSSQMHASAVDDDGFPSMQEVDEILSSNGKAPMKPRPTSRHLNWLVQQQHEAAENRKLQSSASHSSLPKLYMSSPAPDLDNNYQPYTHLISPPREILTDCSLCGTMLDSIRYVCSTCGEKPSIGARGPSSSHSSPHSPHSYPPRPLNSPSNSQFFVGSSDTLHGSPNDLLRPTLALQYSSSAHSSRTQLVPGGYELCANCFQEAGIHHAIEAGLGSPPMSPHGLPGISSLNTYDSTWRRTPPKKGQTRHAFQEKLWGEFGWDDVAQDETSVSACSICQAVTSRQRYKCAACPNFQLCRACYSLAHDIHPNDAFILVPDKICNRNGVEPSPHAERSTEEQSLEHPGVSCAHCLLPIVGARFHCAICDSVDICSNCEAAGLPGNLDSIDGGHNSAHILIKSIQGVRYQCAHCPSLPTQCYNLCSACDAKSWAVHDPKHIFFKIPRPINPHSLESATPFLPPLYETPAGPSNRPLIRGEDPRAYLRNLIHKIALCDRCMDRIVGEWFRCANCSIDLCEHCESVDTHAEAHVFVVIKSTIDLQAFKAFTNPDQPTPIISSTVYPMDQVNTYVPER